jgi:hypothetical protein
VTINEKQKPYQTTQEEQNLRWKYGRGKMTKKEFDVEYEKLKQAGKIKRSGKAVV